MPLYNMLPTGIGFSNAWLLGAGASKQAACAVDDDDTTYIWVTGGSSFQAFTVGPVPILVSVEGVKIGGRARITFNAGAPGNEALRFTVRLGVTNLAVVSLNTTAASTAWTTLGPTTSARPGGGSWTPADLATVQTVNQFPLSNGGSTGRVTYVYLEIDGTPAVGGFACLVGSLAGAALGLAEMSALAREVFRRTRTKIMPDEYLTAWRDIRNHLWPKTFEMRGGLWI